MSSTTRIAYSVDIARKPEAVWQVFTHWQYLLGDQVFRDFRWLEGEPWQAGSRMEVDMVMPFPFSIQRVITAVEAPHKVTWINHAQGITAVQWTTFEERPEGTHVQTWAEYTAQSFPVLQRSLEEIIHEMIRHSLDSLKRACEAGA